MHAISLVQFNVYRWAGKMLVDAARLRNQERVTGRLAERARRLPQFNDGIPFFASLPFHPRAAGTGGRAVRLRFRWNTFADCRAPGPGQMRARTRNLLGQLVALYPCIIISGRARETYSTNWPAVKVARVIGNHGAETEADPPNFAPECTTLEGHTGGPAWLDSGVVDRKQRRLPGRTLPSIGEQSSSPQPNLAAARTLPEVRVFRGKQVINLVPSALPIKEMLWRPNGPVLDANGSCLWATTRTMKMLSPYRAMWCL